MGLYPAWAIAAGPISDADVAYLSPRHEGYRQSATPFNKRIKTQPSLIAVCMSESGVAKAVRFAISKDLRIAVKSGGHSFEGLSLNSDGLVIDVSQMNGQQLDGTRYTAGPGVKLKQAYEFLLPRRRIVPTGSCGSVGLSGLTLGGGYGMFSRKYGLTCDNLVGVRMIDGKGQLRDSDHDPALLWACRGGGNGNFGVITQMRYDTHPAPTHLPRQRIKFHSLSVDHAAALCERWFLETAKLPNDAFSAFVLNGSTLTILITSFEQASRDKIQRVTDALAVGASSVAKPANEVIEKGVTRYYGADKPLHFKNVSAGYYNGFDDLRDGISQVFESIVNGRGLIFQINTLGGAIADPRKKLSAAYPHRMLPYLGELQSYWDKDSQTDDRVAQVNRVQTQLRAMGIDRHYRNYPSLEIKDWSAAYYSKPVYGELQKCKAVYDPLDRIGHAQSIKVSGS